MERRRNWYSLPFDLHAVCWGCSLTSPWLIGSKGPPQKCSCFTWNWCAMGEMDVQCSWVQEQRITLLHQSHGWLPFYSWSWPSQHIGFSHHKVFTIFNLYYYSWYAVSNKVQIMWHKPGCLFITSSTLWMLHSLVVRTCHRYHCYSDTQPLKRPWQLFLLWLHHWTSISMSPTCLSCFSQLLLLLPHLHLPLLHCL